MTWPFQILALADRYSLYVPDLLFFGESTTDAAERTPAFQADCLAATLDRLHVRRCTAVGFSYGGMVASSLAERWPGLVGSLVLSSSVFVMTESISSEMKQRLGVSSWPEILLPASEEELETMLSISIYRKLWFPRFLYRDFLHAMFKNSKKKVELLEAMVVSQREDDKPPSLPKCGLVLYGENDNIFHLKLAHDMKENVLGQTLCVPLFAYISQCYRKGRASPSLGEAFCVQHKELLGVMHAQESSDI
ncbi:lipase 1-like [Zingiber officinale]|uniref:lipase 1-like n=1 Tax=Zingiber officinale TaxID=94328 RepID=UPI001C4C16B0|nr:lipase 1-like [Zingiber officinale]